jgi:HlyD family secretion protein
LPASALLRREKNWFVFVVESDRVREQQVIIGQRNAQRVQLIEGLAADDRVVLYPGVALEEGTAVSVER